MSDKAGLPQFRVIEAALRATTERLVREVPDPQDQPPEWDEFEWGVARAVCAMQGISGLLATRLRWRGPSGWQDFLAGQHAHMVARERLMDELLSRLAAETRAAGIACVPLKGSALRHLRLYGPGERPQSDVDLLLDRADFGRCARLLGTLGYELLYSARRHDVYLPAARGAARDFGEHRDNPLKIELHDHVSELLPIDPVDITASIRPASLAPGLNPYASRAALLRHVCLHAAGCMRANAARFIQVCDIGRIASRLSPADWQELLDEGSANHAGWWLFPPLALAARFVEDSIPVAVLDELRRICPRRLRTRYEQVSLYEVSWSNLRIPALPGHEWSRTVMQTLRFARSRAWPSRIDREELAVTRVSLPHLMQVPWYGIPHVERIARWLVSRPPRVQTISAVSAALRDTP